MNITLTNDQLNELADSFWIKIIEDDRFDQLTSDEVTVLSAKIVARAATYASDAVNW